MSNYYTLVFHFFKFVYELENIFANKINTYEAKTSKINVPKWYKFVAASISDMKVDHVYKIAIGSLYAVMLSFLAYKILG